ncbi:MAG: hypothetical protein KY396_00265 [Actinobacteria bacterium]|nr:hypothetical protein [Actinomycetota bacterium]
MTDDDVRAPDEPAAREHEGDESSGEDEAGVLGDAASVRGPDDEQTPPD